MKRTKQICAGLLAALMLALVFVPCSDSCDDSEHQSSFEAGAAQEHHEEHQDMCSPFCVCSCCSTSVTVNQFSDLQIHFNNPTKQVIPFYQSFISEFSHSIWQPPKIS